MSQYIFVLVWLAFMMVVTNVFTLGRYEYVLGKKEERLPRLLAICTFIPILWMAATRGDIGDTWAYKSMYKDIPENFINLLTYLPEVSKDKGFTLFSGLIKIVFGNNTTIYFFILALIQSVALVSIYRKYSPNYVISVFLFVASTDYLSWMFNGVRQFTAVTIIFAATPLMLKKKWGPLLLIILFATTIHASAILMLPVVFIIQGKPWNKKTIAFILLCIIALIFADQFTNVLDTLLFETQYTDAVSEWKSMEDDGTNILRVLVYSIPMILSLIGRKWLEAEDNSIINLCTNMAIITSGLYVVSAVTSGIFIGRLPIYTSLYGYILLPYVIDKMFTKESALMVKLIMMGAYLVFYYYQIHIGWALI